MPDLDRIARIIRETAATEIVPRFRALEAGDIREKKPGDLVTVADLASEARLVRELMAEMPGSVTVGEEGVHADPTVLDRLAGDAPVWIIDPIDGTGNFAKGDPGYAVIVALVVRGVTEAGWIFEPMRDRMVMAKRGDGAWSAGCRLAVTAPARPEDIIGSAHGRTPAGGRASQTLRDSQRVGAIANFGSSGVEYLDVAVGATHFTIHSRSLPWDHAAGMMIVAEAGGVSRFVDGSVYDVRVSNAWPHAAASESIWQLVADIILAPAAP